MPGTKGCKGIKAGEALSNRCHTSTQVAGPTDERHSIPSPRTSCSTPQPGQVHFLSGRNCGASAGASRQSEWAQRRQVPHTSWVPAPPQRWQRWNERSAYVCCSCSFFILSTSSIGLCRTPSSSSRVCCSCCCLLRLCGGKEGQRMLTECTYHPPLAPNPTHLPVLAHQAARAATFLRSPTGALVSAQRDTGTQAVVCSP